jgi:cysteinyl-tRNA synthetase
MKHPPSLNEIGLRVSIRSHDPSGGFRDLLGHLVSIDQVRKKDGQIITFDPDQIALWKVVPSHVVSTGISLYDTLSRELREIKISDGKALRMYCCGPTVYRDAHVGNLRTFLLADLITRLIIIGGNRVHSVQNITDVGHMSDDVKTPQNEGTEDKILSQAQAEHRDPFSLARSYEAKFHEDLSRLGIAPSALSPRASESIEMMLQLINNLIETGHAYLGADGTVYFSANSFDSYGALSGNKLDQLVPGHHYEYAGDGPKRFHADWALWKAAGSRSEMVWDSPWGRGFPGWHIECSAMSLHYLQGHVDLHLGGIDLRFPHHENERAQSNCAAISEVTDHWVHGEHLLFEGRKMSKSSGNVVLLQDVIDRGFDPLALRLVFLENKYRSQMDLTWDLIAAADSTLTRWRRRYQEWSNDPSQEVSHQVEEEVKVFFEIVRNDLDTPKAMVKIRTIERDRLITDRSKAAIFDLVDSFLGLEIARVDDDPELSVEIQELIAERANARSSKDFVRSDELRSQLLEMKIKILDGPTGQSWEIIP